MDVHEPSHDRLVEAVIVRWERHGAAAVSARVVARDADVPVSSIYHHFGDMGALLTRAGEVALARATDWCDEQRRAVAGVTSDLTAFAHLLTGMIDDWCERQRSLAFACREVQLRAMRDPVHQTAAADWSRLWRDFWSPACDRFGIADLAPAIAMFFDGETSMHLLRGRRLVDRSALAEMCTSLPGWLEGRTGAPAPWRTMALHDALAGQPAFPVWDTMDESIAAAAARTVARCGVGGLTHRAVAAEAGLTLGVVSNRLRSSADLLRAAFEALYRRIVAPLGDDAGPIDPAAATSVAIDDGALRASFELTLAAARDPAFRPFTAQLRYLRGRTSGRYLRGLVGPKVALSVADTAVFSALLSGQTRARLCGDNGVANDASLRRLLGRLSGSRGGDGGGEVG